MLEDTMAFILEAEKLKGIERRSRPPGLSRRENPAEHSWSLALMAMTLTPQLAPELDLTRVMKLVVTHDLVEIDADDTFCYADQSGKAEREHAAAERIFGLLPTALEQEFWQLWNEFEAVATPEARFANALDRVHPILLNFHGEGGTWKQFGIRAEQVEARLSGLREDCLPLWDYTQTLIHQAVAKGWLH
ncbi:putative hydrolase of HD superfamily [Haloferula luteola]|uniref:Putative hydrolase of HD superfamily n=1 Tax=Haloferula luteola TaxID=595692 RepID=A0A840VKH8_9BACT|nr:HD domain-containing protein [Haloferula luteola]MBB5353171.1 putative hydrolase of HD superfamily [Haloferula luteola]